MKLFEKKNTEVDEKIADMIMEQEDRLSTLFKLIDKLPDDLIEWFKARIKQNDSSDYYVDIDIARTLQSPIILPGDIVIKKNRDPKIGDLVDMAMRGEEDYWTDTVKVLKVQFKDSSLYVQNIINPETKGNLPMENVLCIIDKIIKCEDAEWKKLVQILNIDVDIEDIIKWIKRDVEHLEKNKNFHDRTNNLKKLNDRLKFLKG